MRGKLRLISVFLIYIFPLCFTHTGLWAQSISIDSMAAICMEHLNHDRNEEAYHQLELIEKKVNKNREDHDLANYYAIKSSVEERKENYAAQLESLNKFVYLGNKLNDPKLIARGMIGFSGYYEQFGDLKKALPFFLKALDQFTILGDEVSVALIYNKLGLVHYSDQNYTTAKNYFLASFALFKKHEKESEVNAYWIQNNLSNIGLCFQQLGQYKRALAYMFIAYHYCETAPFHRVRPMAVINTHIGSIYKDLKQYDLAVKYLNAGIKDCLDPKYNELEHGTESLIYLASIYNRQGKFEEANRIIQQTNKMIMENGFYFLSDVYYRQVAKLKYQQKDFQGAFIALDAVLHYQDSMDKAMQKSSFSKLILLHDLEKQKAENDLLNKQNQYNTLVNKVIVSIVVLFIIFIGMIVYSLSKSKDRNKALLAMNQQITEQKIRLQNLNKTLERINQNKSYLLQSIAHDLRSPIGNVISLNMLLQDHVNPNEESKEYQDLIQSSCLLALNIIEDILDQSLIERGKFKLRFSRINIHQIILESIELLKFRSDPKGIITKVVSEETNEFIADGERIKRVLLNLLMNAIKFSSRNSEIVVTQYIRDSHCVIAIKDQGIGMSPEILSQIFDRNNDAGRPGLDDESTIGIGLSITRSIIEGHGGKIKVESEPDSGSTFYIELPIPLKG